MAGVLYDALPQRKWCVYMALVLSMIAGRVVWGIVQAILVGLTGSRFTWSLFIAGAVVNAVPGIVMQIVLIPVIVVAMERAGLSLKR